MCTLILARDVLGPRTMLLAANRDERPDRPSVAPDILMSRPRVAGGRDLSAGGTWLALREDRAAVALLNRRDPLVHAPPPARRSRGLLTLDVAAATAEPVGTSLPDVAEDELSRSALETALRSISRESYAPFTLVYASPTSCWMVALESSAPRVARIEPGWHVLTHRELDDPEEPRAAHLLADLRDRRPASREEAETLLRERLRSHGDDGPPVCLHEGLMATVSSSLVWMDESGARYSHAEGRPCEHAYQDRSGLLAAAERAR
ncbi:MAG TPA: NRDE family protein [Candidatus Eisenbacteria bacterium]|nr:NRDE family protein [Candidatus Eisenbacteria bacterium]